MATLGNQLFDHYQINTLGFDVVFTEKDESYGLKNLEWMQQQYLKDDVNFAEAYKKIYASIQFSVTKHQPACTTGTPIREN